MPPLTVPEPTAVAPSKIVTVSPAVPAPVKDRKWVVEGLSVFDVPESDAAVRSGVPGAAGAAGGVVSMVTDRAPEATLTFPAVSVDFAVMLCTPSVNAEVVIV